MLYTDTETKWLQTAENRAWRYILQAPGHATNASLRSEIGASSQKYRDMKSKLLFAKHLTENQFTNQLFNDSMIFHHTGWSGQMQKYLKEANIHPESLQNISVKQITDKVNSLDKAAWEKEIHSKSTLSLYSSLKTEIRHEEHIYDNSEASRILFEARTNCLRLGWREEFKGNSTACPLCQHKKEDLLHFLSKCPTLNPLREKTKYWRESQGNQEKFLKHLLLFKIESEADIELHKSILLEMWQLRKHPNKQPHSPVSSNLGNHF